MRKIVVFGELVGEKKRVVFGELGRVDRVGVPCRAREARPLVGYARPLFGQTESGPLLPLLVLMWCKVGRALSSVLVHDDIGSMPSALAGHGVVSS